ASSRYLFCQAEDGIRDATVTGVQTCALPILSRARPGLPWPRVERSAAPIRMRVRREVLVGAEVVGRDGRRERDPSRDHRDAEAEIGRASCREGVEVAGVGDGL